jgi:DNA repair protein RadD
MDLRPYQSGAVVGLREALRRLQLARRPRRVLLVSPTGSGKTVIMADVIHSAERRGSRTLFLAHRKELIDQTSRKLDEIGVDHGVIQAGHERSGLGGCRSRSPAFRLSPGAGKCRRADLVVSTRPTIPGRDLRKHSRRVPGRRRPRGDREPVADDGLGLRDMFEEVVVAARPRELIEAGHLVPYTGFAYDSPDLAGVGSGRGDYKADGLEIVMGSKPIVGNVVEQYRLHGNGGRAVVFAVSCGTRSRSATGSSRRGSRPSISTARPRTESARTSSNGWRLA